MLSLLLVIMFTGHLTSKNNKNSQNNRNNKQGNILQSVIYNTRKKNKCNVTCIGPTLCVTHVTIACACAGGVDSTTRSLASLARSFPLTRS